jgi:hypothetical protein
VLSRAVEEAAGHAADVFVQAIMAMTFQDVFGTGST